jgi:hypothetical protein
MNDGDVVGLRAALTQRLQSTVQQTLGYERIETADYDGEALARCV